MKLFVASLFSLCIGCAYQAANREPQVRIVVDVSVSQAALPAWLAYAGTRSRWMTQTYQEQNAGAGPYQYTFAEEAAARSACARVWLELREFHKAKPDVYLDQLIEVFKSGYIPEYTWVYLRDPRWVQPASLRLPEFEAWRRTNLRDHKTETRARAEFE
ncbi:MAG TPA: hypothetical protein VGL11_14245 [Candidatus Binatia bacterium]